jgi:hypothetical protein
MPEARHPRTQPPPQQRRVWAGCGAPRRRREAQGSWPRAQRASSFDSSRLFERSERSSRSEFRDGAARPSIAGQSVRSTDRLREAPQTAHTRLCRTDAGTNKQNHPRRAASIAAMSIFPIPIMASNARLAAARSGSVIAAVRARGVICHDSPHLSLHQPHALSWPPFRTIAFPQAVRFGLVVGRHLERESLGVLEHRAPVQAERISESDTVLKVNTGSGESWVERRA